MVGRLRLVSAAAYLLRSRTLLDGIVFARLHLQALLPVHSNTASTCGATYTRYTTALLLLPAATPLASYRRPRPPTHPSQPAEGPRMEEGLTARGRNVHYLTRICGTTVDSLHLQLVVCDASVFIISQMHFPNVVRM